MAWDGVLRIAVTPNMAEETKGAHRDAAIHVGLIGMNPMRPVTSRSRKDEGMCRWKTGSEAIAVGVAALALGACSGDDSIDTGELENQLRVQLSEDAGGDPDDVIVECPEDIRAEAGRQFECELTAPNGDLVAVEVTLTDDDGSFEAVVPPQQFED